MNKDRYAALDDAQKKAVDAVRGEWFTKTVGADMDAQMHDVENRLRADNKHHLIEFSAEDLALADEKLKGVIEAWQNKGKNAAVYQKVLEYKP